MASSGAVVPAEDKQSLQANAEAVAGAEEKSKSKTGVVTWQMKLAKRLKLKNRYVRLVLAEFLGTFVLCSIGIGSIAQKTLFGGNDGTIVTIIFGWGIGVAMGIYVSGGVSGGHINPAVSTAMALLGNIKCVEMPFYWIGQYLGAFLASFFVWVVYVDGLNAIAMYHSEVNVPATATLESTAGIWATFPKLSVGIAETFADQVFATMLLVILASAITDERNMKVPKGLFGLLIGLGVVGILSGYAANCGGALNPARDLAPRIFLTMAGWGGLPFTHRDGSWFWVPIVGPHIGAILGALVYNLCVGLHWPDA